MKFIQIAFPILMVLLPAAIVSLVPANPNAKTNLPRARRLLLGMWIVSFGCIALWFGLAPILADSIGPAAAWLLWLLFFPLWFGFGAPILSAKNPDWISTPPPDVQVRAASIATRQRHPVFSPLARRAPWIIWGAFFIAVLSILDWTALVTSDEALLVRRTSAALALGMMVIATLNPLVLWINLRAVIHEPQPLDPDGSPELTDLYTIRTRQRAMLFIGLAIATTLMLGTMSVIMAVMSRGQWSDPFAPAILGGTLIGFAMLIGIGGGVFATLSSIQAARINHRLRELTRAEAASA